MASDEVTSLRTRLTLALGALCLFSLTGCGILQDQAQPLGTRERPLDQGSRVSIGEWQVSIVETSLDAEDKILAENFLNSSASDGYIHVLWTIEATYAGDSVGDLEDVIYGWDIVGGSGRVYSLTDGCGVPPNRLDRDGDQIYAGSTRSGTICREIAKADLAGAVVMFAPWGSSSSPAYFAIPTS